MENLFAATGNGDVALAALALAASSVAGLIWVAKRIVTKLIDNLAANTRAQLASTKASLKQAQTLEKLEATVEKVGLIADLTNKNSRENLRFLKALNGNLRDAAVRTIEKRRTERRPGNT